MNSGYVIVRDSKDREFEVEYSLVKGRRAMFDPSFGNWFPSDPDEVVIESAVVTLGRGKKTKYVSLTEKQLLSYISRDSIEDAIYEKADYINDY